MKIGFIGGGAMAEALTNAIINKKVALPPDIYISELRKDRCSYLQEKYGVYAAAGPEKFIKELDILILAVKPQVAEAAMAGFSALLEEHTLLASIVAGLTLTRLEKHFPTQPVIRIMPNTPMSVGAGMAAFALGKNAGEREEKLLATILSAAGRAVMVKESMMDAVTGLSGSGPAYGFLIIDALADGGVAAGLPRKDAIMLAAQTMLGAAQMVLETGRHPDALRDQVTSPAGTTIAGVRILEQRGVRGAMIDAVIAATQKSEAMGK